MNVPTEIIKERRDQAADVANQAAKLPPSNGTAGNQTGAPSAEKEIEQVLLIESSSYPGRRIWMRNDQRLVFGRTERSDVTFAHDHHMSRRHFEIKCSDTLCQLRDLGSRNGTLLNGVRVRSATLRNGDKICAGDTILEVNIRGGNPNCLEESDANARGDVSTCVEPGATLCFRRELLPGDTVRWFGDSPPEDPVELMRRLASWRPMVLLLDFSKLETEIPDELSSPRFIMDWLPEKAAGRCSPVFISNNQLPVVEPFLADAWSRGAVMCVYSALDEEQLLLKMRAHARGEPEGASLDGPPQQAFGFFNPQILDMLVRHGPTEVWNMLFNNVDAYLIPSEETWELLMPAASEGALAGLGFELEPDEEAEDEVADVEEESAPEDV